MPLLCQSRGNIPESCHCSACAHNVSICLWNFKTGVESFLAGCIGVLCKLEHSILTKPFLEYVNGLTECQSKVNLGVEPNITLSRCNYDTLELWQMGRGLRIPLYSFQKWLMCISLSLTGANPLMTRTSHCWLQTCGVYFWDNFWACWSFTPLSQPTSCSPNEKQQAQHIGLQINKRLQFPT